MAYHQYCSVARSLDVVGDRWTLLIVRELLARPARFTDLRDGLPGIAPNLLSARLKDLQERGVIERRLGPQAVLYALTPWGEQLREPIEALARWGAPLMKRGREADSFRPHWLVVALEALLGTTRVAEPEKIALHVEGEVISVLTDRTGTHAVLSDEGPFAAHLIADGSTILAVATGARPLEQVIAAGIEVRGDQATLKRILGPRKAAA